MDPSWKKLEKIQVRGPAADTGRTCPGTGSAFLPGRGPPSIGFSKKRVYIESGFPLFHLEHPSSALSEPGTPIPHDLLMGTDRNPLLHPLRRQSSDGLQS